MSYRDNLTELFAASLSCGFTKTAAPRVNDFTSSDEMIKLAAGYTIPDLSHDGIVKFVGDLFDRELEGLMEEKPHYAVKLTAISQSDGVLGVKDAAGEIVTFLPNNVELEIPFAIAKGELIPFDVIQLNGERCPYTRENLGKIIMNIVKSSKDGAGSADGYVGLEPRQNATTTSGFLTNMLQVRSRGSIIPDAGGMFITASEKRFENVMDKIADLKPFDWEQVEKVANIMADRDREKMLKHFSDLGAESAEMVKTAAHKSAISKSQPWKKLSEIKHGEFVLIPEMHDSVTKLNQPEFAMTPAYVVRKFDEGLFDREERKPRPSQYNGKNILVITNDHRFMIVPVTSSIICLEANKPLFSLKGKRLKSLDRGDVALFKTAKGLYAAPLKVDRVYNTVVDGVYPNNTSDIIGESEIDGIANRHPKTKKSQQVVAYNTSVKATKIRFSDVLNSSSKNIYYKGDDRFPYYRGLELYIGPNIGKKVRNVSAIDAANILAKAQGASLEAVKFLIGENSNYFVTDEEKKCIALSGSFGKTFTNYDELENYMSLPYEKTAGEDFCGFYKQASVNETVTVTKMNGAFNVSVRYMEKDGGSEVAREERLAGLSESAAMGALLGFGFDESIAKNMIVRASNSGSVSNNLPLGHNTKNIFGNSKAKKIKKVIEKIKNNRYANLAAKFAISRGIVKGVSCATSKILEHTSLPTNERFIGVVMGKLASDIGESKALSMEFEKKAVENESIEYRKIAKALATSAYFSEAVTRLVECPEDYPHFDKIASEVVNIKSDIEDVIYDLMMEKMASYKTGEFKLNPSYYTRAVHQLNDMYELASEIINE